MMRLLTLRGTGGCGCEGNVELQGFSQAEFLRQKRAFNFLSFFFQISTCLCTYAKNNLKVLAITS